MYYHGNPWAILEATNPCPFFFLNRDTMGAEHSRWEAFTEKTTEAEVDISTHPHFHQTKWMDDNDILPIDDRNDAVFASWSEYANYCQRQRTDMLADGTLHDAQFKVLTSLAAKNPYNRQALMERLLERTRCTYIKTEAQFDHLEAMFLHWLTRHAHLNVHFQIGSKRFAETGEWRNSLDWYYNHNVSCYARPDAQARTLRRRPMLERKAFGYPEDTAHHLRPTYGALNVGGLQHGNCCAYDCYGKSFFGLSKGILPRITISENDSGQAETNRNFKVYTVENAMMILQHFESRDWHLLFRYFSIVGIFQTFDTVIEWQREWEAMLRQGLECDASVCEHDEDSDGEITVRPRTYRELGIHGAWNWKLAKDVPYIVIAPVRKENHRQAFAEHFENSVEGSLILRSS